MSFIRRYLARFGLNLDASGLKLDAGKSIRDSADNAFAAALANLSADLAGDNGEGLVIKSLSVLQSMPGFGDTASPSGLFPAGVISLGVTMRITEEITGCDSVKLGLIAVDDDLYGAAIPLVAGTTTGVANFTASGLVYTGAGKQVGLKAVGGGVSLSTGEARFTGYWLELTPPTS